MTKTRVLVVDDSPLLRQVLADILSGEADLEVVGFARDGVEALEQVATLRPDVLTLDIEMPRMSGLEFLTELMLRNPLPVVMVSTLTSAGAEATLSALEKGAVDFVCKPRHGSFMALREVKEELVAKIRSAAKAQIRPRVKTSARIAAPLQASDKMVLIATSTGGPRALSILFQSLPKGLSVPILIVQHMPAGFTASLAARLSKFGNMDCREAVHNEELQPGMALMAPGGLHMEVSADRRIRLFDAPPLHGVRPAADYLFESAACHFGRQCLGVVLTGMGKDGARGAQQIREAGGSVLAECEATCTVYGMPRAAAELGAVSAEFPIDEMAQAIVGSTSGRSRIVA